MLTEQRFPPGDSVATYVVIVDSPDEGGCQEATRDFEPPRASITPRGSLTVVAGATEFTTGGALFVGTGAVVFTTGGAVVATVPSTVK